MNIGPIIVTGMHRSGTSLVSRLLISNNVFLGSKIDVNYESVYFQRINKWILSCNGSTWDNPISLNHLKNNDKEFYLSSLDRKFIHWNNNEVQKLTELTGLNTNDWIIQ